MSLKINALGSRSHIRCTLVKKLDEQFFVLLAISPVLSYLSSLGSIQTFNTVDHLARILGQLENPKVPLQELLHVICKRGPPVLFRLENNGRPTFSSLGSHKNLGKAAKS